MNNDGKKIYENNAEAMNDILSGVVSSVYVKFMHCGSTKQIWDKLENIYEVYEKVKEAKLQTYIRQFKHIKMKEDKDIASYFLHVDDVVNTIRGL
jgi:hypothetical protein